jgi:arylsulfatase A-like enzyme
MKYIHHPVAGTIDGSRPPPIAAAGAPFPPMRSLSPLFSLVPAFALLAAPGWARTAARPNVLLMLSDDLRPQLGCYGDPIARTPHLDAFAREAVRFDRAYVQIAICSPSRHSFLSGLRPGTTGLRGFGKTIRAAVPEVVTLPQHFKNHGYRTVALGKIFHVYAETGLGSEDDPASWSEPHWLPGNPVWGPEQNADRERRIAAARAAGKEFKHSHDWPRGEAIDAPDVPDEALRDGETAGRAVAFLRARGTAQGGEPFFLAVGFYQPHLPFVAPKKYYDLYDPAKLPLPAHQTPPSGSPAWALNHGMVAAYHNFPPPDGQDDAYKRRYLQAYLANISYMDACAGRVLAALRETGLHRNTIVLFAGDHGYLMGELGSWGHKHCNYERATRAPLLVAAPGIAGAGKGSPALVEFVDFYATLAELAGLPAPARHEGTSFVPLLREPGRAWKRAVFSEMNRGGRLGRAIRTATHRYVEWHDRAGALIARELYDYRTDADETENLVDRPENAALAQELAARLAAGWQSARPAKP